MFQQRVSLPRLDNRWKCKYVRDSDTVSRETAQTLIHMTLDFYSEARFPGPRIRSRDRAWSGFHRSRDRDHRLWGRAALAAERLRAPGEARQGTGACGSAAKRGKPRQSATRSGQENSIQASNPQANPSHHRSSASIAPTLQSSRIVWASVCYRAPVQQQQQQQQPCPPTSLFLECQKYCLWGRATSNAPPLTAAYSQEACVTRGSCGFQLYPPSHSSGSVTNEATEH